jgi:hypothetical protein
MGRRINPDAIEGDRKKKRITVPLTASDAATVTRISALKGFPSSRVVGYMIGKGMDIEQRGRILLDRPKWPSHPTDPRYVQAAFHPLTFLSLVELAETAFEPLNVAAAALFKIGLADYDNEQAEIDYDFG